MKKIFIILILLTAFNLSTPNSQVLSQTLRHVIEYTQEDKSRGLTEGEILKNKAVSYLKYQVLLLRIMRINVNNGFNSS